MFSLKIKVAGVGLREWADGLYGGCWCGGGCWRGCWYVSSGGGLVMVVRWGWSGGVVV